MEKVNICGINIDNISLEETIHKIQSLIEKRKNSFIVTPNIDHIVKLQNDTEFKEIYTKASLVLADGMPIIWASKFLNTPIKEKISGSDLFPVLCEISSKKGYRLFFLGGKSGAVSKTKDILEAKYPNINIIAAYCPDIGFEHNEEENKRIVKMIKESNIDILFVGLGAPKQERWIYKYKNEYNAHLSIGIGASFDFYSGIVKRSPKWMQKIGLEWLHRLSQDPKRLWKRYLINDPQFFLFLIKQRLS